MSERFLRTRQQLLQGIFGSQASLDIDPVLEQESHTLLKQAVEDTLANLTTTGRNSIALRYGLDYDGRKRTFTEVASALDLLPEDPRKKGSGRLIAKKIVTLAEHKIGPQDTINRARKYI